MAQMIAENSYAEKKKVGCLIVQNRTIISDGFNGTPSGFGNACEGVLNDKTLPEVLHAEENALMKLCRLGNSSNGASMYITVPPCPGCARLIVQAGISQVFYAEPYKNRDGIDLLIRANVFVKHIKLS
jgi:dCMP deaminase